MKPAFKPMAAISSLLFVVLVYPSYADENRREFKYSGPIVNIDGLEHAQHAALAKALEKFLEALSFKSSHPLAPVIAECNANLRASGFELSSLLITSYPDGAGPNARSLTPEQLLVDQCSPIFVDTDGDPATAPENILLCNREPNP